MYKWGIQLNLEMEYLWEAMDFYIMKKYGSKYW